MATIPSLGYYTYMPSFTYSAPDWHIGVDMVIPEKQKTVSQGNCEGYECIDCKSFNPMSELNFPENSKDPVSFKCYSCRKGLNALFSKAAKK